MKWAARSLLTVFTLAATVSPLTQTTDAPAFEVASVRLTPGGMRGTSRVTYSRVDLAGYPLGALLRLAFRANEYQLVAPDWVDGVRVDVSATLPPGASRLQMPEMLQELLRRRFGAVTRVEQRPLRAYELLVGPKGLLMRDVIVIDKLERVPTEN